MAISSPAATTAWSAQRLHVTGIAWWVPDLVAAAARRQHDDLDNAHLMRMAGRFSRRVRAWAKAAGVPVVDCKSGERKHRIAEEYLATHYVATGVFLILVARAPASVWEVERTSNGLIRNLAKKRSFVNHYSFHVMDPTWGHVTIKMSGHPPFGAQVMLNGHEFVACAARAAGIAFTKEGNCFTAVADPQALARVADTLSHPAAVGRLSQVCDRWIYTACLCFGLDLDEQEHSNFRYELLRLPGRVQPQPAGRYSPPSHPAEIRRVTISQAGGGRVPGVNPFAVGYDPRAA